VPSTPHLLTTLHSEDWHTPKGRFIREVMFGMNDGLVSTIGFVAGATGALMQTRVVLLAGIASVVAGALSMGIGGYLASKSQRDFFESEKERERREIEEVPELERKEIRDIFTKLGFLKDEVEMIVNRVTSDKALWVRFMMREELGILEESFDNPVTVGFLMAGAFVAGGIPPLLPYLAIEDVLLALKVAVAVSLVFLYAIGVGKTVLTKQSWLRSGMEVMLLGSLAAGVGFGIGKLIAMLWPEVGAVGV
jgi:VIT1/CCC1 family predicted Fe2+/Mn2+ transporter